MPFFLFSAYGGTKAGKTLNFGFSILCLILCHFFSAWFLIRRTYFKLKMFPGHFLPTISYIYILSTIIKSSMCHVTGCKNLAPFFQPVKNEGKIKHNGFIALFVGYKYLLSFLIGLLDYLCLLWLAGQTNSTVYFKLSNNIGYDY